MMNACHQYDDCIDSRLMDLTTLPLTTSSAERWAGPCDGTSRRAELPWSLDVLAVDDDAADTALIMEILRRHPRVRDVISSLTPEDALYRLAKRGFHPNLVLLDLNMPKVNGFTFLKALRQVPWLRRTPVVMLTTSRHPHDLERAHETDIMRYMVKPDSFDEMELRINGVIRQLVVRS